MSQPYCLSPRAIGVMEECISAHAVFCVRAGRCSSITTIQPTSTLSTQMMMCGEWNNVKCSSLVWRTMSFIVHRSFDVLLAELIVAITSLS